MARVCAICGKGVTVGMQYSHSHIRTKRIWVPNLQRVKAIVNGAPRRILVCTRCLRSGKVQRAI
ncbi:MAG: 50S ribosomal protein L28 [Bacillota bacterium]|uniref:50S ribosomal protein L28 n=1 Tax=Desulfurispora thermophila TaxID=265470 RepID=UPI00036AB8EC|nr:50S ribosomal protein L28 [Desulfurispora thermophila]